MFGILLFLYVFLSHCWRLRQTLVITPVAKKNDWSCASANPWCSQSSSLSLYIINQNSFPHIHPPDLWRGLHRDGGLIVKTTHAVGRTRLPCDATLLHIVEGLADDGCMLWDGRYPSPPQDDSALSIMHMKRNHEKTCKPIHFGGAKF